MADTDPDTTQRDLSSDVPAELSSVGLDAAQEIGRGGFGIVYRCRQGSLDRIVAVKVLTSNLEPQNLERFLREQHAMGKLTGHPNIVSVFQVGTTPSGLPYIVMQYHPQDSLEVRIRRHGPLTWRETLRLGVRLAGALETAHRIGILHRDVKPGNILLTEYGEPQLTDFGIARIAGAFETTAGTVTGSPAFTAPEVIRGEPPSPASDVYGLGASLFCAMTGHAAFERRSGEQVIAQFVRITSEPIPDLRGKGIPDSVCTAIESAMAGDPGARPATAAEFGQRLREIERRNNLDVDDMALPTSANTERSSSAETGETDEGDPAAHSPSPAQIDEHERSWLSEVRRERGRLPLELTSFVGRRREMTKTRNLLASSRLVTLTGIGGVGKTRLALHAAADVQRTFDDGVCLVDLSELNDPALLPNTAAAALSLRNQSDRPYQEVLADYLATRNLLLVLDNCEHLVDAVAMLVRELLRACPELHILATSREPLDIGGEATLRVPPLTVPGLDRPPSLRALARYEAVALFVERATAAVPDFELTEDNYQAVAEICHQLDGLPLPIELAAVRLRAMSIDQIRHRLTDRYRLLTHGSRSAPTRQQTLRLCIDWSHELCSPQERTLWARLSVFAGSFELDAAEDICAIDMSPEDLLDTVGQLVDKSILIREERSGIVRCRLLDTLRDYGREKLQERGEETLLRRLHRQWYERLAIRAEAEWISPQQLKWVARLEREQPNLRDALQACLSEPDEIDAGLRMASALYSFWLARGLISEGRRWLDDALARPSDQPSAVRVKALQANSLLAALQGRFQEATAMVGEGKLLATCLDDPATRALSLHAEGLLAFHTGDLSYSVSCFEQAHKIDGGQEDRLRIVENLVGLALAYEMIGDTARAISANEEVLAITERHGESIHRAYSLWALGLAVWHTEPKKGVGLLEQGLRLARVVDDPLASAWCLEVLSWTAAGEQRAHRAAVLMGAAEALWHTIAAPAVDIPGIHVHHDEYKQQIRLLLGERSFTTAFQEGANLNLESATAYALQESAVARQIDADDAAHLTERERQVAVLVAEGLTNRAIAAKLVISQRTAQGHVEHILTKLGFTSRAQIAAWVVEKTQQG
ncbi:protein kinase [Rhodococcus koreensis]|uniref:protein kinase domain-containing protein n=1 Tax=Rhodococcus koreensis TaxID=99653 RepID=UPI00366DEA28